jgi:tungstate transport system substrate-binding protein
MEFLRRSLLGLALVGFATLPALAQGQRSITVASTTSTEQSGLFGHLLPRFTQKTGIDVKVVALGTGQALDVGRRGDADVVFVHDKAAEEKFVADGFATKRQDVMYNDFVIVGPKNDPAKAAGKSVLEGLCRVAQTKAAFISRGDRSGTHAAELRYWKDAKVDLAAMKGDWYKEIGQGMGPALNTASAQNAYVLTDRGTWLSFKNRGDLAVLIEDDQRLFNQYGVMLVNPAKHPHVRTKEGQAFIDWLVSPEGQKAIVEYKIGGEQLFFPNASGSARS